MCLCSACRNGGMRESLEREREKGRRRELQESWRALLFCFISVYETLKNA